MELKNFSFRILAVVYGGLIMLSAHFIYTGYTNHLKVAQNGALSTLDGIVSTLVLRVNGDSLEGVLRDYPFDKFDSVPFSDSRLTQLNATLEEAQTHNLLSTPIYTLTLDTAKDCFFVGAASNGMEPYGFHYTTPPKELYTAYYNGGSIPPFEDDHGSWLSALHPIHNSKGIQVGALQVDFPLNEFIMYAREDALKNMGVALLLFGIVGVFLYSSLRKILAIEESAKLQLEEAKKDLLNKNNEVTSSIKYALTIQENILPPRAELNSFFDELMVFNKPRDIVSGDFYWFHQLDKNRALLAVADCTGHGVPGALMSMMGHNYLNDAIAEHKLESPAEILEYLDLRVCETFRKNGSSSNGNNGMDLGLCLIDKTNQSIVFSGARRPLTIIDGNMLSELEPTRRGIGEHFLANDRPFINTTTSLENSRSYFLYSDGLQDQFGGDKNGKLMKKRLVGWLVKVLEKPKPLREAALQSLYQQWKGDNEQIDDICLIGFKV
ncbi:MAG: PP2C family protein-serine/threonine phosphatase [Flavobacteriales bacterium]